MKTNEELCRQYQTGDRRAGDALWERNQRLIYVALHSLNVSQKDWDDAESAAAEAFAVAMIQWRPDRGRFSTYAVQGMFMAARRDLRKAYRFRDIEPVAMTPTFEDVHLRLIVQRIAKAYRPTVRLRLAGHTWEEASKPLGTHRNHAYRPTRKAVARALGLQVASSAT